jgi:hypothetical protein
LGPSSIRVYDVGSFVTSPFSFLFFAAGVSKLTADQLRKKFLLRRKALNACHKMEQMDSIQPSQTAAAANTKSPESDGIDKQSSRGNSNQRHPMKSEQGSNRGLPQPHKRKNEHNSGTQKKQKFGRNWDGPTRRERNVDTRSEAQEDGEREERRPKKKVACFIGYSGEGYHGMQ